MLKQRQSIDDFFHIEIFVLLTLFKNTLFYQIHPLSFLQANNELRWALLDVPAGPAPSLQLLARVSGQEGDYHAQSAGEPEVGTPARQVGHQHDAPGLQLPAQLLGSHFHRGDSVLAELLVGLHAPVDELQAPDALKGD